MTNLVPVDFRTTAVCKGELAGGDESEGRGHLNMKVQTRGGHGEKQQNLAKDWG